MSSFKKYKLNHIKQEGGDTNKDLFDAIKKHNLADIRNLLENSIGIDINIKDETGNGLLHYICNTTDKSQNVIKIIKLLLDQPNIDVNITNNNKDTSLHLACKNNNFEIVKLLIEKRPMINQRNKDNESSLLIARRFNDGVIREFLSSKGEKYDAIDLQIIQKEKDFIKQLEGDASPRFISTLNQLGIYINDVDYDSYNFSVLMYAIKHDNEIAKILVRHIDTNVNLQNSNYMSALIFAMIYNNNEIAELLLTRRDIDVNLQDKVGNSALMYAIKFKNKIIFELLLARQDLKINIQNNDGRHELLYAIQYKNNEFIELLLRRPEIDINVPDKNGDTALIYAINLDLYELCKLLISNSKLIINLENSNSNMALIYALKKDSFKVAELLLKQTEINVNTQDDKRKTALIYAIDRNYHNIITLLFKHPKINIDLQDNFGKTPVSYLITFDDFFNRDYNIRKRQSADKNIKILLCRTELKINEKNYWILLLYAIEYNNIEIAKLLLDRSEININSQDNKGNTALMYAVEKQNDYIIKLLLNRPKININLQNREGNTAFVIGKEIVNKNAKPYNKYPINTDIIKNALLLMMNKEPNLYLQLKDLDI